jgi:hypothetical protein
MKHEILSKFEEFNQSESESVSSNQGTLGILLALLLDRDKTKV